MDCVLWRWRFSERAIDQIVGLHGVIQGPVVLGYDATAPARLGAGRRGVVHGRVNLGADFIEGQQIGRERREECLRLIQGQRWLSQVASSRACRITGIRLWIWATSAFASVVRMAKVV